MILNWREQQSALHDLLPYIFIASFLSSFWLFPVLWKRTKWKERTSTTCLGCSVNVLVICVVCFNALLSAFSFFYPQILFLFASEDVWTALPLKVHLLNALTSSLFLFCSIQFTHVLSQPLPQSVFDAEAVRSAEALLLGLRFVAAFSAAILTISAISAVYISHFLHDNVNSAVVGVACVPSAMLAVLPAIHYSDLRRRLDRRLEEHNALLVSEAIEK